MKLGIGIDTGGTYTDAVIYDFEEKKVLSKGKSLTTKDDLSQGIGNVIDKLPMELLKQAKVLSLSTTLATNACVENKGGRAKLIFVNVSQKIIEMADAQKEYGLNNDDLLLIDKNSEFWENEKINWEKVYNFNQEFFKGASAVAISEMNGARNQALEEKSAKNYFTSKTNLPFVCAHELSAELNVLARGATALLNARLLPIIEDFMKSVEKAFLSRGIDVNTMIVRSDGSLMPKDIANKEPVKTMLSGPAASVIGGKAMTNEENCLVIDIGGTTTDISIVKNTKPKMSKGICLGGWKTQIQGVYIDSFGLGGDSQIILDNEKLALGERRVQPISTLASQYPSVLKDLEKLDENARASFQPLHEFFYLVKQPENTEDYSAHELRIIEALKNGPVMLGSGVLDLYSIKPQRLEAEGIIMRCGLTPTDIMNIKGDFSTNSDMAARYAVKQFIRSIYPCVETAPSIEEFCEIVYDMFCKKLYEFIIKVMMEDKYTNLFSKGFDSQMKNFISETWKDDCEIFAPKFQINGSLIGIGAPTNIFLPKVAEKLNVKCIIPENYEVANAIGAVVADINAKVKVQIDPIYGEGVMLGYRVFAGEGTFDFEFLEDAVAKAEEIAKTNALLKAKQRGAIGELVVNVDNQIKNAILENGSEVWMGMAVVATVSGRVD